MRLPGRPSAGWRVPRPRQGLPRLERQRNAELREEVARLEANLAELG